MDITRHFTSCPMMVISPAFQDNERIPVQYTEDGDNLSPPLIWANAPAGVREYAITCEDRDVPEGDVTHWVIYHIPNSMDHIDEGVRHFYDLDNGAMQGKNSFGDIGYMGPSPPIGKPHRYAFTVYALDARLNLRMGVTKDELLYAMQGHVVGTGTLIGIYAKGSKCESTAGTWDKWLTGAPKSVRW